MYRTRPRHTLNPIWIFLGIVAASVAVRLLTAEYIDIGGDNSEKWRQVHYLIEGLGYTHWYQQTVRWGILLPLAGLMKTFGLNPVVMYIQPILYSSLAAGFIYLIGERLHSRALGITTAFAAILFPQMAQTGSQLWPGVFELGYIALCVWLILVWLDTQSRAVLILASLVFFLGWGCRVTMIYAAPGLALLIFMPTGKFKPVFLFFGLFGLLCAVEWIAFWQIAGYPMGRFGIISGTHLQTAGLDISLHDYLLNITKLTKLKGLIAIWALCFLAAVHQIFTGNRRWCALALLYLIHAFLLLYMVSSLSPLKLAMPVGTRFWGVIAPIGLLLLFRSLFSIKGARPRTGKVLIAIVLLAFIGFTVKKIPPVNSVLQLDRDYTLLAPLMDQDQPILLEYEHWQPNFIEGVIIQAFTGKKGKRIPTADEAHMAIIRTHARMVALFETDLSKHEIYKDKNRLHFLSDTKCLFLPPGISPDTPPAAEIRFGRKLHKAIPVSSTPSPSHQTSEG